MIHAPVRRGATKPTIWFDEGYSSIRDALAIIGREARGSVRLLASHRDPHAPVLAEADMAVVEPAFARDDPLHAERRLAWSLDLCRAHGVALFVPQKSCALLADAATSFAQAGVTLLLAGDADMLALLDDKARFTAACRDAGLPVPCTYAVHDIAGFDDAWTRLDAAGLPACIKPPVGVFGAGFWRLDAEPSLFASLMNPDARRLSPNTVRAALAGANTPCPLLVMEYLSGPEWSVDCLCDAGRLIVGIARRKLGRAQRIEVDGPVIDLARAAIALAGVSGLVNVQCRAADDAGDDIRLLEINARMSGGCLYTAASGVHLPWWHVALPLGLAVEADLPRPLGGALVAAVGGARVLPATLGALADA